MKYYNVSFKYSERVFCANIAHAETIADVEAHYLSRYSWASIREAAGYEVETARAKGMPIVEIEAVPPKAPEQPAESAPIADRIAAKEKEAAYHDSRARQQEERAKMEEALADRAEQRAKLEAEAGNWDMDAAIESAQEEAKQARCRALFHREYQGEAMTKAAAARLELAKLRAEAQKAREEAGMEYFIPETGETVTAGELAADLIASGDSPETAREIIRGMAAELAIMPADGSEPLPASDLPGHDWLTAENIEILREALRQAKADYEADPSVFHVRISRGNGKMGRVPSISILPVLFCPACCRDCNGCGHICYALKLAVIRASVRRSWAINTAIMLADWAKYWAEIREALAGCEFFRFHVSGEIAGRRYFREMIRAAEDFPGCQMLCFTKQFETVNAQIDETGALPVSLRLLFSGMPGRRPHNPHNLPETTIILKGTPDNDIPSTWRICPGQCESCAARNIGCWLAQPGDIIAFHQH